MRLRRSRRHLNLSIACIIFMHPLRSTQFAVISYSPATYSPLVCRILVRNLDEAILRGYKIEKKKENGISSKGGLSRLSLSHRNISEQNRYGIWKLFGAEVFSQVIEILERKPCRWAKFIFYAVFFSSFFFWVEVI